MMKFMNKDSRWNGCSSRSKFGKDICSHIIVMVHMVDFQSCKLVLELSDFFNICVYCILVDVSFFIYLLNDK